MIVADANVVAHFFITGGKTALARQVRERDSHWIVPEIWRHEFMNILVSSCLFAKLPREVAGRLWQDAEGMLRGRIYAPDMNGVLATAVERSTTAYDAEYVVLAMAMGVQCVTEDGELQKKYPAIAVCMEDYLKQSEGGGMVCEERARYGGRRRTKNNR